MRALDTLKPSRFLAAISTAAVLCLTAASAANAVPLDKLTGGGVIVAGNVTFSNFRAPSFVGMGPSAVDVQPIVLTDATGTQVGAGLRFTPLDGKGINPLVQCATCGGSKEIVMNAIYQVNVTDGAHLLYSMSHPMLAASAGANAAIYNFTYSSIVGIDAVTIPTPPLSGMLVGCVSATPCTGINVTPDTTALTAFTPYAFVNQQVQMLVSGRKGQSTGHNELTSYDVIFGMVPLQ